MSHKTAAGKPVKFRTDSSGKVVELWIERSRWARRDAWKSDTHGGSQLLNYEGGMCCLGFYARACGASPKEIFEIGSPASIGVPPSEMNWLIERRSSSAKAAKLIYVNDQRCEKPLNPKEQEKRIREIFAENGVKIRIVK